MDIVSPIVPPDLTISAGPPRFGYRPDRAQAIIARVAVRHPQAALVLRLQLNAGLRLHEATHLRSEMVGVTAGTVRVKGKGGRVRTVRLLDTGVLAELPLDRRFVFPPTWAFRQRVQAEVRWACEGLRLACRGTHGFRATFAELRLEQLLAEGLSERQARRILATELGHNRTDVTRRYVP